MYWKRMDEPRVLPVLIFCHPTRFFRGLEGQDYIKMPSVMQGWKWRPLWCDLHLDAADSVLGSLDVVLGVVARGQTTKEDEDGHDD
jgi:hypothetical protein